MIRYAWNKSKPVTEDVNKILTQLNKRNIRIKKWDYDQRFIYMWEEDNVQKDKKTTNKDTK